MQLRKLAASALGALMAGATLAFPAAAASLQNYPAPFVSDGDANFSIVVGSGAKVADVASAIDVAVTLGGQPTVQKTAETGAVGQYSISQGKKIQSIGDDLNWGDTIDLVGTLDDKDLSSVLASGTVTDDSSGDEYDYDQEIALSGDKVAFGKPVDEWNKPQLYLDMTSGSAYNLTVDFDTTLNFDDLDDSEEIAIAGSDFTVDPDFDPADGDLTLFQSKQTVNVGAGESATLTIGGEEVTVEVVGANTEASTSTATISIGGETYQKSADESITVNGEKLYISDIFVQTIPEKSATVKFFVGADEVTLPEDGGTVEVNGEDLGGVSVSNGGNYTAVDTLKFTVTPSSMDEDNAGVVAAGEAFTDPLFGSFKIAFSGAEPGLTSDERSEITIERSGSNAQIGLTNLDGDSYSIQPYKGTGSTINLDNSFLLNSSTNLINLQEDDKFTVNVGGGNNNVEAEDITHIYEVTNIDNGDSSSDLQVELQDLSTGNEETYENGDQIDGTNMTVKYDSYDDAEDSGASDEFDLAAGTATLNSTASAGVVSVQNTFIGENKEQVTMEAPGSNATINVNENPMETDESITATNFNVTVESTGDYDVEIGTLNGVQNTDSDEDNNVKYGITNRGTYVELETDNSGEYFNVYTAAEENDYAAFVGPEGAEVSKSAGGQVTYQKAVPITSSVAKLDTAISEPSAVEENLILVGGPCVNMHVATLIENGKLEGVNADATQCFNQWKSDTPEIQLVEDAFADGQTALVVAGMTKEDTANAAAALQDIGALPDAATKNV